MGRNPFLRIKPNKTFCLVVRTSFRLSIARHKPTLALYELSCALNQLPLDTFQRTTIDGQVTAMCNAMGVCDRIFVSPVPVIYTRFLARFVELFMAFVPFALYEVRFLLSLRMNEFGETCTDCEYTTTNLLTFCFFVYVAICRELEPLGHVSECHLALYLATTSLLPLKHLLP